MKFKVANMIIMVMDPLTSYIEILDLKILELSAQKQLNEIHTPEMSHF